MPRARDCNGGGQTHNRWSTAYGKTLGETLWKLRYSEAAVHREH